MKNIRFVAVALMAAGMMVGGAATAQTPTQATTTGTASTQTSTQTTEGQQNWTVDQLITSSVHDAWMMSGRNEQRFFEMVTQLAQISAQKRGLTLPDNEETGKHFGELVKSIAKTDHDQLLYVVVDKAVQQVATKS